MTSRKNIGVNIRAIIVSLIIYTAFSGTVTVYGADFTNPTAIQPKEVNTSSSPFDLRFLNHIRYYVSHVAPAQNMGKAPDNESLHSAGMRTVYNSQGNLTRTADVNNFTVTYSYDSQGKLTSIIDTKGAMYKVLRAQDNKPIMIEDSAGKKWALAYDMNGNIVSASYEAGKSVLYSYDHNGTVYQQEQ